MRGTNRHPVNFIDDTATVALSARVWHFSVLLQDVRVGPNVNIGSHCEIGRGSVIGEGTRIGSGTFLPPHTIVGRNVFIGPHVACSDDRHPRIHQPGEAPYHAEPPVIEDDAVIGLGAVLLPGVRIGTGARIGAGAVVSKDVPPHTHVRGEPAREKALSAAAREMW